VGIQAETPGSAACAAFEAVATALERDLEDEKRERREQVGFLNKSYSQEKDLLVQRTEALERQLVEARSLWSDERTLLIDRLQKAEAYSGAGDRALRKAEDAAAAALQSAREEAAKCAAELEKSALTSESRLEAECSQIEARSARWSGSYEAILSKNATLEVELDAERRSGKVGIEAAERSAAAHLRDHESSMAAQAERLEEETRAFRRAFMRGHQSILNAARHRKARRRSCPTISHLACDLRKLSSSVCYAPNPVICRCTRELK